MVAVTVGVPVYNGEAFLAESLECLRAQTFGDMAVVVYDNCSTDRSAAIAQRFVECDPRFSLVRQPLNRGSMANFQQALMDARSPYFMWRAFDDLSALNYVEELHRVLGQEPNAVLASCTIRSQNIDGSKQRLRSVFHVGEGPGAMPLRIRRLFQSHASWYYGLWRTPVLRQEWERCTRIYPHAWGSDHLMMFAYLLDGSVQLTDRTDFLQRIKRLAGQRRRTFHASVSELTQMRSQALTYVEQLLEARYSGSELRLMRAASSNSTS
jgi:glycosyltransferase involved in cell wall biosynthesis